MHDRDLLFNDFLLYLSKWRSGETPDQKQFFKNKPYHQLWNCFLPLFFKGICPASMQAALEHEKWKLLKSSLSDDEALDTILLEKLLYHFYLGNDRQIAELAAHYASDQLRAEYAILLNQLWSAEDNDGKEYTKNKTSCEVPINMTVEMDKPDDSSKPSYLEQCFLGIQMEVDSLLEIQKIEHIIRMLKLTIPKKVICALFPDMDPLYLDTIISYIDDDTLDLYHRLFNKQLVTIKPPIFNDKNLSHGEARIYQLLQYYFNMQHSNK